KKEPDFALVRDPENLRRLPDEDREGWEKTWKLADEVLAAAKRGFRETTISGKLTAKETTKTQEVKMTPGKRYIVDYESSDFFPYLLILDTDGKIMAGKRDDNEDPHGVHLSFLLPAHLGSSYRFVLSSHDRRGTGTYFLRLREFKRGPEKDLE